MPLRSYYPEMGEEKPAAVIEARLSHYGKHWFLWTPLDLAGRGIERLETESTVDHRRVGWHRYKVTERAFGLICERHEVASESLL